MTKLGGFGLGVFVCSVFFGFVVGEVFFLFQLNFYLHIQRASLYLKLNMTLEANTNKQASKAEFLRQLKYQ